MSDKYTYKDWLAGKDVKPANKGIGLDDYYRGIAKAGRMEYEHLHKIRDKQKWIYENAIEINKNASIASLKSELRRSDFPESYLQEEIDKINTQLEEQSFIKKRVLEGADDYYNMTGDDLKQVVQVLEGENSNPFYQIYCETYKNGEWVPNEYLRITSLLHYKKFLSSLHLKAFLAEPENVSEGNRGRKRSTELTVLDVIDYLHEYEGKYLNSGESRRRFRKDKSIIKSKFRAYIMDDGIKLSRTRIDERINEALEYLENNSEIS